MDKFTLTHSEYITSVNGKAVCKVMLLVSTEADVPKPREEWYPGSMCQIADTHKYKVLNREGAWE